jgi:predicted nucleic-acid-binding protein
LIASSLCVLLLQYQQNLVLLFLQARYIGISGTLNGFIRSTALQLYAFSNIDFSDAQILQASLQQKIKLLSFGKKLQKLKGVVNPDFI